MIITIPAQKTVNNELKLHNMRLMESIYCAKSFGIDNEFPPHAKKLNHSAQWYRRITKIFFTAGKGAHEFVLNREGEYVLSQENIRLKDRGDIYSLGGLRKDWTPEHLGFVEFLEAQGYKLRYRSGFVPDINQILIKNGGILRTRP